jgi:hypothetical protein
MALSIRRREFITLLGGAAVARPVAARAQQPAMPVVGFLNSGSAAEWAHLVAAFKEGLNEVRYVEGRNVAVEYRWAQGQNDRLPGLAADLIRRQVAVIVAFGPPAAVAAKAATATIPIIFVVGTDPIDLGLVASISRPTSNLTGLNIFSEVLTPKRQELLHELVPTAPLVAMLVNPTSAQTESELRDVQAAADKLGQQVRIFNVGSHPTLRIAPLVPPHGAHRSGKRPRHVRLLGEARLHQEHHRIGLGDHILGAIVMHRQSGDDDHPLTRLIRKLQRALMTTVFDAAGEGSAKACWVLMRRARADKLESASSAAKPSPFQGVAF